MPDTDSDGIDDAQDSCRTVAGLKEKSGCPRITAGLQQTVAAAARALYFQSGSAALTAPSFIVLDQVAMLLLQHPDVLLEIEGHTDNQGTES